MAGALMLAVPVVSVVPTSAGAAPRVAMTGTYLMWHRWGAHGVYEEQQISLFHDGTVRVNTPIGSWTRAGKTVTLTFQNATSTFTYVGLARPGGISSRRQPGTATTDDVTGEWFAKRIDPA
jgi:hypothetical protein